VNLVAELDVLDAAAVKYIDSRGDRPTRELVLEPAAVKLAGKALGETRRPELDSPRQVRVVARFEEETEPALSPDRAVGRPVGVRLST